MANFQIDLVNDHVDDSTILEIFADGVRLVSCSDGVLKVELTVTRPHMTKPLPAPPKMRTHTVARLAITTGAGAMIAQHINTNLEHQSAMKAGGSAPAQQQPKH
jgi:hypothetical protein